MFVTTQTVSLYYMTTFAIRSNKNSHKATAYFSKMHAELDLEKYKLDKYKELFNLTSFQNMHDADLAYHNIYCKCAENARTKESLLNCLEQEERLLIKHPNAFNPDTYQTHTLNAINEIKQLLKNGSMDHLYN